jgi:hypothetical protein
VSLPNPVNDGKAVADALEVAEATYRAAVARWPAARITLRQARGSCMRAVESGLARRGSYARTRRTPTTYLPRADPMLAR